MSISNVGKPVSGRLLTLDFTSCTVETSAFTGQLHAHTHSSQYTYKSAHTLVNIMYIIDQHKIG